MKGPLSTPIGIIGLGRSSIFTKDYLNSITPYFTACEVLLEAHMNRPSSVDTPQPDDREVYLLKIFTKQILKFIDNIEKQIRFMKSFQSSNIVKQVFK